MFGGCSAYSNSHAIQVRRSKDAMPFKSKAQRRKFAELLMKGEISAGTFEEWNRETGLKKLPERVKSAPRKRPKLKRTTKKVRSKGETAARKRAGKASRALKK